MKIVRKGELTDYEWVTRTVLSDVTPIDHYRYGWEYVSKENGYKVMYERSHWEPEEEWVGIQVKKSDLITMGDYGLKWRRKP